MSEILRYQKELDELRLKFREDSSFNKIKMIYEYIKSVNSSGLPRDYKEAFISAAKNEIPIESLSNSLKDEKKENPSDFLAYLLAGLSGLGGGFLYDIIKNGFLSLSSEGEKSEKGV